MDPQLLTYYEAIERASADMLNAARAGHWDEVVKLEGACVLLISQLKHAAQATEAAAFGAGETLPDTEPAGFDLETAHAQALATDATRNAARSAKAALAEEARARASAEAGAQAQAQAQGQTQATCTAAEAARAKARIMQRILVNDAEIRQLAEPWLHNLDDALQGRRRTLH